MLSKNVGKSYTFGMSDTATEAATVPEENDPRPPFGYCSACAGLSFQRPAADDSGKCRFHLRVEGAKRSMAARAASSIPEPDDDSVEGPRLPYRD